VPGLGEGSGKRLRGSMRGIKNLSETMDPWPGRKERRFRFIFSFWWMSLFHGGQGILLRVFFMFS
jgi:hypothetical protein